MPGSSSTTTMCGEAIAPMLALLRAFNPAQTVVDTPANHPIRTIDRNGVDAHDGRRARNSGRHGRLLDQGAAVATGAVRRTDDCHHRTSGASPGNDNAYHDTGDGGLRACPERHPPTARTLLHPETSPTTRPS